MWFGTWHDVLEVITSHEKWSYDYKYKCLNISGASHDFCWWSEGIIWINKCDWKLS